MDDIRIEQAKFQADGHGPAIDAGELPWAYGEDRITVVVRDPDSAYLYWEITDPGIAAARERLGPAGAEGGCALRVYDTTARDFDGTNANDYFDLRVDRADREYFVMIRRPGSTIHVEIGIKTHEGYFQAIARSGRADFPRSAPSPDAALDWMTVTSAGAPPCTRPCRSRYAGPEPALPERQGAGYVDVWRSGNAPPGAEAAPARETGSWSSHTLIERHAERWWKVEDWRTEWRAGLRFLRWEHLDPERVAVELLGETPGHVQFEGGEMVVYGPWRVTVRGFDGGQGRRVLATWSMRWVQATTPMIERWERVLGRRVVSAWEREHVVLGGSEAHALLARGASELLALGGSERMWLGASEWVAGGASETLWGGASERLFLAASGRLGASEWLGGSERAQASRFLGASEHAPPGERWGGRLEPKGE